MIIFCRRKEVDINEFLNDKNISYCIFYLISQSHISILYIYMIFIMKYENYKMY